MPFLGVLVLMTGLWNLKNILNLRHNRSKNKQVSENAVTRAHGDCSLRVMGALSNFFLIKFYSDLTRS